ncbi:MAG: hypothetical protein EXQ58_04445 [Acidobacteria bacterium]|nr:hypothetical protein [Acidobacteriota bacterium]
MPTNSKYFCDNCGEVKRTTVQNRREVYPVKGEPVEVTGSVRLCTKCGIALYDRFLDSLNQQAAFEIYRRKHHIISPVEIKTMRDGYGLSQRGLGTLLGWGEVTIHRYETGSLPDDAHNQVLRLIREPSNMKRIVDENGARLLPKSAEALRNRLLSMLGIEAVLLQAWIVHQPLIECAHKTGARTRPVYRLHSLTQDLLRDKKASGTTENLNIDSSFWLWEDHQDTASSVEEFSNV